ncbi:phosphodiester glycosidase family protein [Hyalangium rubrum]|uniref:Phosphodiester glycosidase family protein n=1 Tax=Hyalangium rubrum TaxID=3103134 RepID=A0ABU5HG90_9BACT|nr:phosphodiester glycosidase family protein [Hyalangium sp. s54d21]MDY7232476.1 phosphodiester glycosidase family protein [Hyalangium sp. s54d21]
MNLDRALLKRTWIAGCALALVSLSSLAAPPLEARTVRFAGTDFHVVTVDLDRASLRLLRQDDKGQELKTFAALEAWLARRGERLLAATNAGIFEPGEVPTGLFIQEGRELAPLNLRDGKGNFYWKPNGVFLLGPQGAAVLEASRFRPESGAKQATQSGPLLLAEGKVHPGFASSKGLATRSGVGVDARSPRRVYLVLSQEPVRLATFAALFQTQLGCTDALYMDGNISRLYPPALQGGVTDTGGAFSGFLAVVEKK